MSDAAQVDDDWSREHLPNKSELQGAHRRLIFGALALLAAISLLGGFYFVTQRAVERAHVHWAQAVGVSKAASGCDSAIGSAASGGCQSAGLQLGRVSSAR